MPNKRTQRPHMKKTVVSKPWMKPANKTRGAPRHRGQKSAAEKRKYIEKQKAKEKALGVNVRATKAESIVQEKAKKYQQKNTSMVSRKKSGEYIAKRPNVAVMGTVISPRGRDVDYMGQPDPLAGPQGGQPMSKQDYFLTSRAISYAAYDEANKMLEIGFVASGAVYMFYQVSQIIWEAFRNSASKGRFFVYRIRNQFQYKRIR